MSDSISGVIIPLIIPVDAPAQLATGVQTLALSLENGEYTNACLQLQQSFCYLTWHFADYSARQLLHLGLKPVECTPFGHARLEQHLDSLQKNLDLLAGIAEQHPEAADLFRVFYVGGLRARQNSPRRHTRLLGLGGQFIRGYRSILEWCRMDAGEEELSTDMRCQRELRRYLPILREWLDSSSGHFRNIKNSEWYQEQVKAAAAAQMAETPEGGPAPQDNTRDALASVRQDSAGSQHLPLHAYPTPLLLFSHQLMFEQEMAQQNTAAAGITLGRLAGLAVQYLFSIAASSLRLVGQLDPALEKRLDSGLTLRQKQTSLSFLFKALHQHADTHPILEKIGRVVHAPSGGKLSSWLAGNWGSGNTLAEFATDTAKPELPPQWEERFIPGVRIWLKQMAPWFAEAEHYFQNPNEAGLIGFTVQVGDEHLEIDRRALQLDTAVLKIPLAEVQKYLRGVGAASDRAAADLASAEREQAAAAAASGTQPAEPEGAAAEPATVSVAETAPDGAQAVAESAVAAPAEAAPPEATAAAAEPAPASAPTQAEQLSGIAPDAAEPATETETVVAEPAPAIADTAAPPPAETIGGPAQTAEAVVPDSAEAAPSDLLTSAPPVSDEVPAAAPSDELLAPVSDDPADLFAGPDELEVPAPLTEVAEAGVVELAGATDSAASPVEEDAAEVRHVEAMGWTGPGWLLEHWDTLVDTAGSEELLRLHAFLLQYSNGVSLEWARLQTPDAEQADPARDVVAAFQQFQHWTEVGGEFPWFACLPPDLLQWLRGSECAAWLLHERTFRERHRARLGSWIAALQTFFAESEQMFEEPTAQGYLEGVVIYQDQYLEFVDHPVYTGPVAEPFWPLPAAAGGSGSESAVAAASPPLSPADFTTLPADIVEFYGFEDGAPATPDRLAATLEFLVQYYAGFAASIAVQNDLADPSQIDAWRSDSNLQERHGMLMQMLERTSASENSAAQALHGLFNSATFGPVWKQHAEGVSDLALRLRRGDAGCAAAASLLVGTWLQASQPLWAQAENLTEPINARGHLELVIHFDEQFFELVEPEYAIQLLALDAADWRESCLYAGQVDDVGRHSSEEASSPSTSAAELLGATDTEVELAGGAATFDDSDDFFGAAESEANLEDLFKAPERAPEPVRPAPRLVQAEESPASTTEESSAEATSARPTHQLNALVEELLQKPAEPPPETPRAETTEKAPAADKAPDKEKYAPARLDAPKPADATPDFIVMDPPRLEYTVHYLQKEGSVHHGKLELRNTGGGVLKGTVKSNHPCMRVKPSVFRSNESEIEFWIDDSDRPSNTSKIGLSFHFSNQKVEIPMEKLLPMKKFKQLATKMLSLVKGFREKR